MKLKNHKCKYRYAAIRNPLHPQRRAAFTLVEVIVALGILAVAFMAVFTALRTCADAAHHAQMLTESVLLAETLLTQTALAQNLAFQTTTGIQGPFTWQVQVLPTPVENLALIVVKIEWTQQQRKQQYNLVSLLQIKTLFQGK